MNRKIRSTVFSAALLAALLPGSAMAYVLVSTPAELNTAINNATPGDTILMANGAWVDITIDFDTDGLPGQPITLRAEVDGQVTLEGSSKLQIAGDYLVVKGLHFKNGSISSGHIIEFRGGSSDLANHSRLTECAITDYNPDDSSTNYKWVGIYGLSNRVDHCSFSGMDHIGVTLAVWLGTGAPANHHRIDNNYFGDHASGGGANGWETIRIGTSTRSEQDSETLVEDNYFYRCDGEIEIISNKSVGNIYRRNTFEECEGQLTLRHGHECLVEGNFFLGNGKAGASGVRVIGRDHVVVNNYFENLDDGSRAALILYNGVPNSPLNEYIQVERALIAFNTFYQCDETMVIGAESSSKDTSLPPKDCVIANNIMESSSTFIDERNTPINMHYEGNIYYGAALGITEPPGMTNMNPLLSLAADGLMRPATNSPAVDTAVGSYPDIILDMDGDTRVTGTQDIGADELAATSLIYGPLDEDDVGPRWMKPSTLSMISADVNRYDADISFEDQTGLASSYELERSENLISNDWSVVATYIPVAYTSTVFSVTDPSTNGPAAFWRVSRD